MSKKEALKSLLIITIVLIVVTSIIIILDMIFSKNNNQYGIDDPMQIIKNEKQQVVCYDKDTKVMYLIVDGNPTVMLDSDGKPRLYEGGN